MAHNGYGYGEGATPVANNIIRILKELGYEHERTLGLDTTRIVAQCNRYATGAKITKDQFRGWIYRGKTMSFEQGAHLARALGMDMHEMAFGEPKIPRRKRKPGGLLDEVDPLIP